MLEHETTKEFYEIFLSRNNKMSYVFRCTKYFEVLPFIDDIYASVGKQ